MADTLTLNPTKFTVPTDTAQVEEVTLTGTSGTASISAGGLTKTATFSSDLIITADNFLSDFESDYLAVGIVLSVSSETIIFTADVPGTPFTAPTIENLTGDLDGTIVNTVENTSKTGEIEFTTVLPKKTPYGYTGRALIEWVSGTRVYFNANGQTITSASASITSANPKIILPLSRGSNLKFSGTVGAETFNIIIIP